jgi:hypothetical protein
MPGEGFGKDVMAIAFMFGSIGLWALVLGHAQAATSIISTAGKTYACLLSIVTLQSNYQNAFNS